MNSFYQGSLAVLIAAGLAGTASAQQIGSRTKPAVAQAGISVSSDRQVVRAGESVAIAATGTLDYRYAWRVNQGKLFGRGSNVRFDTTGLTPGRYEVTLVDIESPCSVPVGSALIEVAGCPDLTLSADRTSVTSGESVLLTAGGFAASSNFVWSATGGVIQGNGVTARLETGGVPTSMISVRVSATDVDCTSDQVLGVSVTKPMPIAPSLLGFGKNDSRLDNADKAQLDDVAIRAGQDIGARVVIVGSSAPGERAGIARLRAERTRDYLVNEKRIDASRIDIRANEGTGDSGGVEVNIVTRNSSLP